MSKEKENKLVPKLRFPEFRNDGVWREKQLGSLGEPINGLTYSPKDVRDNGILVLRSSNVQNGEITLNDRVYVREDIKGANLSQPNDILICVRNGSKALIGKNAIIPIGLPLNTHGAFMTIFRAINPKFVYQLFQSDVYFKQVNNDLGATINSINVSNLIKYRFAVPESKEQRKIADCLSSLDDLITAENKKLETLKAHKKGLMQQLFPAEGEKIPKLRFKEFNNSGNWEVKALKQICEVNPSVKELPKKFVYIDLESVEKGKLLQKKSISIETAPSRAQRFLKSGDVIFQMVRPYQMNNYFFRAEDDLKYVASTGYAQLRAYESDMYLYQYLHNQRFVDKVLTKSTGSNYPAINSSDLSNVFVEIPKLAEQKKIADFLSSLDNLISEQEKRVESLQLHKKGLMQQLFPNVNKANV